MSLVVFQCSPVLAVKRSPLNFPNPKYNGVHRTTYSTKCGHLENAFDSIRNISTLGSWSFLPSQRVGYRNTSNIAVRATWWIGYVRAQVCGNYSWMFIPIFHCASLLIWSTLNKCMPRCVMNGDSHFSNLVWEHSNWLHDHPIFHFFVCFGFFLVPVDHFPNEFFMLTRKRQTKVVQLPLCNIAKRSPHLHRKKMARIDIILIVKHLNAYLEWTIHLYKEYNESQERVISTAANAVHNPYPIPRICLVQGPPGTGKSYTIVGLVKEILNVSFLPNVWSSTSILTYNNLLLPYCSLREKQAKMK